MPVVNQMPEADAGEGEGRAPEQRAPEHVQQDARAGHAQQRGDDGAADGREQNGREKGNAAHAELAKHFDDVARLFGEDGLAAQPALVLPVLHPGAAYPGEEEKTRHHAAHGEGQRGPEMQAHGRPGQRPAQKLYRAQQEYGSIFDGQVVHGGQGNEGRR